MVAQQISVNKFLFLEISFSEKKGLTLCIVFFFIPISKMTTLIRHRRSPTCNYVRNLVRSKNGSELIIENILCLIAYEKYKVFVSRAILERCEMDMIESPVISVCVTGHFLFLGEYLEEACIEGFRIMRTRKKQAPFLVIYLFRNELLSLNLSETRRTITIALTTEEISA